MSGQGSETQQLNHGSVDFAAINTTARPTFDKDGHQPSGGTWPVKAERLARALGARRDRTGLDNERPSA